MAVKCLRCQAEVTRYRAVEIQRPSPEQGEGSYTSSEHAWLTCPQCGHIEFMRKQSPLLEGMEFVAKG